MQNSDDTSASVSSSQAAPRRAPAFRFTGQRAEFLRNHLYDFFTALKAGKLRRFWPDLFEKYWLHFPWRLPIDVDPHCAMDVRVRRNEILTGQDLDRWTATCLIAQKHIKAYLFHKRLRARLLLKFATPLPLPQMPGEILRSREWWVDYHRRQRVVRNRPPPIVDQPNGDQGLVYTFIPTRTSPLIGVIQNDGRLLVTDSDPTAPSIPAVHPLTRAPRMPFISSAAKRAEARHRTRPTPEEELLVLLQQTPEERRRREVQAQLRSAVRPMTREERKKKKALAAAAAASNDQGQGERAGIASGSGSGPKKPSGSKKTKFVVLSLS
ncbi:hypothetical protein B0H16DRAFT_1471393 [Mycena metata]|uniref:Uncharacterized protein n=1 Tax=Mycena metata TaxID=1033252 RepID=A0AAD7MPM0_9AGAR|nr:hypothetical protein B0H16DRAFT_1471393 [Mycena metata]